MTARARLPREVFVRRRLVCIFLPIIILGMAIYMWASMQTLTANGGSFLGLGIAFAGFGGAAWDGRYKP